MLHMKFGQAIMFKGLDKEVDVNNTKAVSTRHRLIEKVDKEVRQPFSSKNTSTKSSIPFWATPTCLSGSCVSFAFPCVLFFCF